MSIEDASSTPVLGRDRPNGRFLSVLENSDYEFYFSTLSDAKDFWLNSGVTFELPVVYLVGRNSVHLYNLITRQRACICSIH